MAELHSELPPGEGHSDTRGGRDQGGFLSVILELISMQVYWKLSSYGTRLLHRTKHYTVSGDKAWASCIHLAPDYLYLDCRWYIFLFCEDGTICDIGTGRLRVEVGVTMAFLPLCFWYIDGALKLPNFAEITDHSLLFFRLLTFFSTIGQECAENLQRVENRNASLLWGILLNTWSKKCQVLSREDSNMQKVLPIQF